jgi:uncharacterized membrane protein YphA (DoxX/SURF4 family)
LFRLCFVYFGIYILITQILTTLLVIPKVDFGQLDYLWPVREIVTYAATHVFHVHYALVITGSGSGDKTFDWVEAFCLLALSIVVTAAWSVWDRNRPSYPDLYKWFHLVVRFALGSTMFAYGFSKLIPLQMSFPSLTRLVEPFGNFSPMGVLWYSIGASKSYEIFAGCAEIVGGVLVMIPRTRTLGALVCLADMIQIFMLNMTYDVPVKLFAFHLILLSVILLAPEFQRLTSVLLLNRATGPSTQAPLFRLRRTNDIAVAVQIVVVLYLVGINLYNARQEWLQYGGGAPRSALYGIWNVDWMSLDGQEKPPLVTDSDRWRRAIFQIPENMNFERMDETLTRFATAIDTTKNTLILSKYDDKNWKANFTFQRLSQDHLVLDGDMDGHKMRMELSLLDRNKFLLVSRGFHWIQEYPLNR